MILLVGTVCAGKTLTTVMVKEIYREMYYFEVKVACVRQRIIGIYNSILGEST